MFKAIFIILLAVATVCFMFLFFAILSKYCKPVKDHAIRAAVIHHTAGRKETDKDLTVEQIDRYHKSKGWNGIGYHFVIRKNGDTETGRNLDLRGAHAKGRNHYIGIALTGYDEFTEEQIFSLIALLNFLGVKHIENHHEYCPGPKLNLKEIADTLNITFKEVK